MPKYVVVVWFWGMWGFQIIVCVGRVNDVGIKKEWKEKNGRIN